MFRFFKKAKKSLVKQGKFTNYLLYALGEIVLVVVGILIALEVNDLNEERKINKKVHEYLISLREEFYENLLSLNTSLSISQGSEHSTRKLVKIINQPQDNIQADEILNTLSQVTNHGVQFSVSKSVLEEMTSASILKDVSHPTLKQKLFNWPTYLEALKIQEELLTSDQNELYDLVGSEVGFHTWYDLTGFSKALQIAPSSNKLNILTLLQSKELENKLLSYAALNLFLKNFYYGIQAEIKEILELIEQEIHRYDAQAKLSTPYQNYKVLLSGTALQADSSNTTLLQLKDAKLNIWETKAKLQSGEIIFQMRGYYGQNWGGYNFPSGQAVFNGDYIPVSAGSYHIKLNLDVGTYEFISLEE